MNEEKLIRNKKEEAYSRNKIIVENEKVKKSRNYYEESIYALTEYMKENEQNPSENKWDNYVLDKKYLSSKTIGFLSGIGFNNLCRKMRKELNRKKRQKEE